MISGDDQPNEGTRSSFEWISTDEIDASEKYQIMPSMSTEEYTGLKASIEQEGIDENDAIVIDEDGYVLDGHHTAEASEEVGLEEVPTVRKTGLSEEEKKNFAYRRNMARRHLDGGSKREVVKTYLLEDHISPDDSQKEIAEFLSVSQSTVSRAKSELASDENVESYSDESISTEDKKDMARETLEENPDITTTELVDKSGLSRPTVRKIRDKVENYSGESVSATEQSESGEESEGFEFEPPTEKVEATPVSGDEFGNNSSPRPPVVDGYRSETPSNFDIEGGTFSDSESDEEKEKRKKAMQERAQRKKELGNHPGSIHAKQLFLNWGAHIDIKKNDIKCPVCGNGSSHLMWVCKDDNGQEHRVPVEEAKELAGIAWKNHGENAPELEGTEYEDVAASQRGWDGKHDPDVENPFR